MIKATGASYVDNSIHLTGLEGVSARTLVVIALIVSGLGSLMHNPATLISADVADVGPLSTPIFTDWVRPIDTDERPAFDFISAMDTFSNGTVLHVYRNAPKHAVDNEGKLLKRYSRDGGVTWTTPTVAYDSPYDDRNIGGGIAADDTVIIALQRYGVDSGWVRSTDGGATWEYNTFNVGVFRNFRGNLIEIPEQGKIGITGDASGTSKTLKIAWSTDGGLTFPQWTEIETAVYPYESSAVYLGGGKIFMVWADHDDGDVYQTTSSDYGDTWSESALTNIIHGKSAHGGWLALSGTNLFWLYRYSTQSQGVAWALGDTGTVWSDSNGWLSEYPWPCPADGYGAVTILPNGTALMTTSFTEPCEVGSRDNDLWYAYAIFDSSATTPPSVETVAASDIGETQATLNGNLSEMGTATRVNVSFEWGSCSTCLGNVTPEQSLTSPATFWKILTTLSSDTTYYFRAKAVGNGTSYGSVLSFTTLSVPVAPTVVTDAATDIGENSVRLNGNLTDLGTAGSVSANFQWGECAGCLGNETTADTKIEAGTYFFDLNGLSNNTTYYFRAKAEGDGAGFGETKDLTTASPPPPPEWSNTAPTINNPITTDEGTHNVTYSYRLSASDTDANQTLVWTLETDAAFLVIESQNRTAWVIGTPTFTDRDRSFYVNMTVADQGCGGSCNLTAFFSFTLYINNIQPTITNKISTDTGAVGQLYLRDFDHQDVNGDSVTWALITNASSLNVNQNGTVSGTPGTVGTFYVNVTVGNSPAGDFVNYTLTVSAGGGADGGDPVTTFDVVSSYEVRTETVVEFSAEVYPQGEYTYLWEFGDGQVSNEQSPTHHYQYAFSARFNVRLTVCSEGQCTEVTQQVTLVKWTYLAVIVGIVLFLAVYNLVVFAHSYAAVNRAVKPEGIPRNRLR